MSRLIAILLLVPSLILGSLIAYNLPPTSIGDFIQGTIVYSAMIYGAAFWIKLKIEEIKKKGGLINCLKEALPSLKRITIATLSIVVAITFILLLKEPIAEFVKHPCQKGSCTIAIGTFIGKSLVKH